MEYYSALKRNEVLTYAMSLKNMLSDRKQTQKDEPCDSSYSVSSRGKFRDRKESGGYQGLGRRGEWESMFSWVRGFCLG